MATREERWQAQYAALCAYREEHGHCNVPRSYGSIGRWVNNQRTRYKNGDLSKEHITQLKSIGFCWNKHNTAWEKQFAALRTYKKKHGHCNVPQSYKSLGKWVHAQRTRYKNGNLSASRICKLEFIGFRWTRR